MTEEEYFRKNFPDSCYGDKPLSPHWDYFQYGVEFGERESEEKIKELERKLEQTEKDLADYQFNYPTIKELQKENADLKEEINKIAFARGSLEEENVELKKACDETQELLDKQIEATFKLDKEYGQLKDEWQEQVQKATDEGYARTLQTIQLTKAKEIIKIYYEDNFDEAEFYSLRKKAEQFLSEVEE